RYCLPRRAPNAIGRCARHLFFPSFLPMMSVCQAQMTVLHSDACSSATPHLQQRAPKGYHMSEAVLFTSESVSQGHPDKTCDQISDAIVDALLAQDPKSRIAVETLIKTGMVVIAGQVAAAATIDYEKIVLKVVCDIGYDDSRKYFDGNTCAVLNAIGEQSRDIGQGVDSSDKKEQGA